MRTEELRACLLEYLRIVLDQRGTSLQYSYCLSGVANIAQEQCPEQPFRDEDGTRLKHVIWDLILERVLVPSTDNPRSINDGWPFLSVTDHGRKVIAEQKPVPYDPDGYLARLNEVSGGLHVTVEAYLAEALATFRTGNRLASAVMLGAASEMVFVELCSAIAQGFADSTDRTAFERKTGPRRKMVERVNAVVVWLQQKRAQLPPDWQNVERHRTVTKVADLIRNRRNETGHPQDPPMKPSHEESYALLMLFPDYCEKLYSLKNWLLINTGQIS